jgi:putative two-component system response regulator
MTNSPGYSKGPRFESNVAGRQQREVVAPGNDWGEQTVVNRETQASIMVVDDQPANLKLMEDMLRRQGYGVRSFPRGRMALAAAGRQPPDLFLLDITMPEMNGFEVCAWLKADKKLASIPVIFLSALGETEDKVKAFRSGGVDYVTKPFQFEEVQARIETQLRLHDLQIRIETQNRYLEKLVRLQVQEIAQSQMATIFALAKLAESRDKETGKHLERVQILCRLLATEMSYSPRYSGTINEEYIHNIFYASPLHDIGKVAIPDSILLKPGKLTPDEFAVMKTHTTIGAQTLALVLEQHPTNAFIGMGIEIAQSHHERWDGDGYPSSLVSHDIPVCARIMTVADCYDALRSKRCYKEPCSHDETRRLITQSSGYQFDPDVIRAFTAVEDEFRSIWEQVTLASD